MKYMPIIIIMAAIVFAESVAADTGINSCKPLDIEGERYFLTASISNSGVSNCFTVAADSVVFDLAGFTIDGNDVADVAFYCSNYDNITLINGTFSDWDTYVISHLNCDYSLIDNITLTSNPDRAIYTSSDYTNWTNMTITDGNMFFYISNPTGSRFDTINRTDSPISYAIELYSTVPSHCEGLRIDNFWINGKPVVYYGGTEGQYVANFSDNFSQFVCCDCEGLNLSNMTWISDRGKSNGFWIAATDNANISDLNISGGNWGLVGYYSDYVRMTNVVSNHTDVQLLQSGGDYWLVDGCYADDVDSYGAYFTGNALWSNYTNNTYIGDGGAVAAVIILTESTDNRFENNTFEGFQYTHYLRSNSGRTDFPERNLFINNFFNYSTATYYNPYDTGMPPNFFNNSFFAKTDGTGYSITCNDFDYNGVCDLPFNLTTETTCSGNTCGNLTDYLPLSDEYDTFDIKYNFIAGQVFHDNKSSVNVNVTSQFHSTFNCSVFVDGVVKNSSADVPNATNFYIVPDAAGLADGIYNVNISCGMNTTTSLDVRIDAVEPFEIYRCNDSVDLENTTFVLANNIFESMADWNYTVLTPEGEDAPDPAAACVPVIAFNSTLDCAGYNITGHAQGSDAIPSTAVGINNYVNHAKVFNCNISNWTYGGVYLNGNYTVWNNNDFSRSGAVDTGEEVEGVGLFGFLNRNATVSNNVANNIQHSGEEYLYYSSCPFIYGCNGKDYILQNEELSPFHLYAYEGTSSARLPDLAPCPDNFKLRIVESLDEVTHYDSIKLTEVTHAAGTEAYKDVYGNTYTISDLRQPISCYDSVGDCLDVISTEDGEYWNWKYSGNAKSADFEMSAVITFRKEGDRVKLLWKPKLNARTLNPLYVSLLNFTGTANYDLFEEVILEGKGYEGHKDAILTIYIWNGKEWQHVHTGVESMSVNHAGKWVIPLDLSGIKEETFSIKMRTFILGGGADFIQADFSGNEVISETDISPYSINCTNGAGLSEFAADDGTYSVMNKGDFCEVEFQKPKGAAAAGTEKTYFTKSNGYYTPDFIKDVRENKKNFLTKAILRLEFRAFWTHDSLRELGTGVFFTDNYMTYITTNSPAQPKIELVHAVEKDDNPFNSRHGFVDAGRQISGNNLFVNNSCSVSEVGKMETCVYSLGMYATQMINNYAENMRTCYFLFYSKDSIVSGNVCNGFNGSGIWAYSAENNTVSGNSLISKSSDYGCNINPSSMQFLGNAGIIVTATQGNATGNKIYNNLINATTPSCVVSLNAEVIATPNYWNQSMTAGTRVYSRTQMLGGNYYTNAAGTGISDVCPDADANGFCDSPVDLENSIYGSCSSENCDFLPYSDLYACDCAGYGNNQEWDLTEECYLASPCDLGAGNATFINTGVWYCNSVLTCNDFGGGDKIDVMPNCWVNITDY